jgi:AmpD protein
MPKTDVQTKMLLLWQDGWYHFARRLESPNFGPRPKDVKPNLIVIHSISLPPGNYGTGHVQRLFTNELDWDSHDYFRSIRGLKVSAHFFISRDGHLWQFVSCNDRAWHAGESTYHGKANCNDYSIGIELEGLEGLIFENAQYETLSSLSAALLQSYPVSQVAGHEHISAGRKHDPGAGFDWPMLRRSLGLGSASFPDHDANVVPK